MAIQSPSEFEAILNNLRMKIERALVERGSSPVLETVIRDIQRVFSATRQPGKLKPLRETVDHMTDTLAREIPNDNALLEQLWDVADYIDYRA
jgi:hypothetical protein